MDEHFPDTPYDDDILSQSSAESPDDQVDLPVSVDHHMAIPGVRTQPRAFEDLTLGELLFYVLLRPVTTVRRLWRVLIDAPDDQPVVFERHEVGGDPDTDDDDGDDSGIEDRGPDEFASGAGADTDGLVPSREVADEGIGGTPDDALRDVRVEIHAFDDIGDWFRSAAGQLWLSMGMLVVAILLAVQGGIVLHNAALDPFKHPRFDTDGATWWFVLAGMVVVIGALAQARDWWASRFPRVAAWLRARRGMNVDSRMRRWTVPLLALITAVRICGGGFGWDAAAILLLVVGVLWMVLLSGTPPAESERDSRTEPEPDKETGAETGPSRVGKAGDHPDGTFPFIPFFRRVRDWFWQHALHVLLILVAVTLSLLTYSENVKTTADGAVFDVVITTNGAWVWLLSVMAWMVALGVDVRRMPGRVRAWWDDRPTAGAMAQRVMQGIDWPLVILAVIIVVGAWFRLLDLERTPPEMTSDHIEKLLDAIKVHEGYHAVFFANNGGREAFQMYVVAFIADTLGVGFNFNALKYATVIEGVLTLPAVWWMAQQVIGTHIPDRRQLGRWTGVGLAGLLALSSWHLMLSRLGLRIALTPLTTALVIGFTARVMRHDRMRDWLALGAVLGAGIYFYQANRMLPLIVAVGTGLALLATVRGWRNLLRTVGVGLLVSLVSLGPLALLPMIGIASHLLPFLAAGWWALIALWLRQEPVAGRIATDQRLVRPYGTPATLLGGLLAASVVSIALVIPMFHYTELYSDQFWNRTRGRLYGESAFVRPGDDGVLVAYEPSAREQWERFWDQRDVFEDNFYDALRMYHWEGDAGWISNARGYPAMGAVMGGLLILGAILGGVWVVRERDGIMLLLPVSVLIMLLPSALTLAYTIENPSFTRASGTIPAIFMLAGLPLGMLFYGLGRIPRRIWRVPVGGLVAFVILIGVWRSVYEWNHDNFYTDYHLSYSYSWKPYREIATPMRTFAQGEGSYGNAFMVAWPHWLDHRILGTMAGDIRWPNGLVTREQFVPMVLHNQDTPYAYDPNKPLFVMFHADDADTRAYFEDLFPGGTAELYEYEWETGVDTVSHGAFLIYTVQAGDVAALGQ